MKKKSAKSSRRGLKASDNRPLNPIDPTFSLADRLSLEPELRTLELIYSLRRYLCMARDGEWVDVLRELISLGKAAVPELIAELDLTDEIEYLNALGFILCQINDPRSVSALIRVITRHRKWREQSYSGETSQNREKIEKFLKSSEWWHSPRLAKPGICGGPRSPEIIQAAIERITGHDSPSDTGSVKMGWLGADGFHELPALNGDLLRLGWVGVSGDYMDFPNDDQFVQMLFEERQKYWESWWQEHGCEFLTVDELARWQVPFAPAALEHGMDHVDRAGIARLGALFPTGPDERLGPVQELTHSARDFWTPDAIDLDRDRTFLTYEGRVRGESLDRWMSRLDINLNFEGVTSGLRTWQIDNFIWENIDELIRDPRPWKLTIEDQCCNEKNFHSAFDSEEGPKSVLFFTREGNSGIMQMETARYTESFGYGYKTQTVRYRKWIKDLQLRDVPKPTMEVTEEIANLCWGETKHVTLQIAQPGALCMWSLIDGSHVMPLPDAFQGQIWDQSNGHPGYWKRLGERIGIMIQESTGVTEEMRNQLGAVDILASRLSEQEYDEKTKIYRYTDRQKTELRLYDTRAGKFRMISGFTGVDFDMSPAVAISHRDRLHYDDDDERISSYGCTILDEPGVSLFTCRNRLVMLEIEEIDPDTDFVKFRYKLADVRANGEWF